MVKRKSKKIISLLLAAVMAVGALPLSAMAAPNSNIPAEMLENKYLDALEYTGYNVKSQKSDGTIFVKYGSQVSSSVRSDIGYDTGPSGLETISDSSPQQEKHRILQSMKAADFVVLLMSVMYITTTYRISQE